MRVPKATGGNDTTAPPAEPPASCSNYTTDGAETDIDCGGSCPHPCDDGGACAQASDCTSSVCTAGRCQVPRRDDGVRNGTETDVDCGGTGDTPRCEAGKTCATHADCASDGCNERGVCALSRSCTPLHGGDTCGAGELGAADAQHESCCTSLPLPASGKRLDKYKITAGRMRAFFERTGGNVRAAMANQPGWDPEAEVIALPTTMAEALRQVGPYRVENEWDSTSLRGAAGCPLANSGARTFWQNDNPEIQAFGSEEEHRDARELLDEKMMNCVTATLLRAFCLWDGGDLASTEDLRAAWGDERWPWGADPAQPPQTRAYDPRYVNHYNYSWPPHEIQPSSDISYFVPAPGRRSAGAGSFGHLDVAGALHEWSLSPAGGAVMFLNGSWEDHPMAGKPGNTPAHKVWNRRYYAIGGRCARPAL